MKQSFTITNEGTTAISVTPGSDGVILQDGAETQVRNDGWAPLRVYAPDRRLITVIRPGESCQFDTRPDSDVPETEHDDSPDTVAE